MARRTGNKAYRLSAQSSALLVGLALALLLTQSAFLCDSGILTAFGWSIVASLAGCLYSIIFHWSDLIQCRVPEQTTWRKGILAGVLLAAALLLLGHSLEMSDGSPWPALSIAFVPWCRSLWRRIFVGDALYSPKEKFISATMLAAAATFIFPELLAAAEAFRMTAGDASALISKISTLQISTPRSAAILSALVFGAVSSLQRPQDRTISSRIFWTIPVGAAAILLSSAGWVAMHVSGARMPLLGQFESLATHRLLILAPALLFGVVMLGIRPQSQITNAQLIGKDAVYWWQLLGLAAGILCSLFLLKHPSVFGTDAAALGLLLLGQIFGAFNRQASVRFAPALSSVQIPEGQDPVLTTRQQ